MPIPTVSFTDERLPNGLRLVIAEDHLAPVVAVNIWYNVGSKMEQQRRTGFAHLFEHMMFQAANVGKASHRTRQRRRHEECDDLLPRRTTIQTVPSTISSSPSVSSRRWGPLEGSARRTSHPREVKNGNAGPYYTTDARVR